MMEKQRLACTLFEVVLLATIIIAIWVAMFLPVAVYFLPLDTEPSNFTITHKQELSDEPSTFGTYPKQDWNSTHIKISCQDLLDTVQTNGSVRDCQENFFADPVNGHCKPNCSSWLMFDEITEITSLTIIGISTAIGILTTIIIITVSFVHFKGMLKFPFVLIIYQDVIISVHGVFLLVGFMNRNLFCSSEDLLESYRNFASPFCTLSGIISSHMVYPLTLWISIQVGYTLLAVRTPLYFKRLTKKKRVGCCLHVTCLLAGLLVLLIPTILTISFGGYSPVDTRFPPIVCWAKDRDITVFTFIVPMGVMLSIIVTELVLILHYLLRHRCLSKSSSRELKQAEIKVFVICCGYVLLGFATLLGYSMSSATLEKLHRELLDYFDCEHCGLNSGQTCDRSGYERLTNPPMITIAYSLLALYPVITLVYIVRIRRKPRAKQAIPDVTSSL